MDFTEPPSDPIRERDEEEAWFDDEEPAIAPASGSANGSSGATVNGATSHASANGIGSRLIPNGGGHANAIRGANGLGSSNGTTANGGRFANQNGQGEYDY